jgi:hypothetical protein
VQCPFGRAAFVFLDPFEIGLLNARGRPWSDDLVTVGRLRPVSDPYRLIEVGFREGVTDGDLDPLAGGGVLKRLSAPSDECVDPLELDEFVTVPLEFLFTSLLLRDVTKCPQSTVMCPVFADNRRRIAVEPPTVG